jgi:aminopeptidase N
VLDYAITLDLPDRGASIDGRAVLTIRRWLPVDTLVLDLVGLRVDSVLVDDRPVSLARTDSVVRIPITRVVGDSFSVAVATAANPRTGSSSGPIASEGGLRSVTIGPIALETGFRASTTRPTRPQSRGPSVRQASGEWWRTASWMEETPLPVRPGAVPRTLTRWRESRPISVYLMVTAAAPLVYYDLGRDGCGVGEFSSCVRQSVYVPESREFLPALSHAPEIVRLFSELIAPFPYEKLAHLQSSTRYGGMERTRARSSTPTLRSAVAQCSLASSRTKPRTNGSAMP